MYSVVTVTVIDYSKGFYNCNNIIIAHFLMNRYIRENKTIREY